MKQAFTLVELIVVITILTILSTIGFVAYTDYLKWVRDSNRIQQVASLHNAFDLYATRSSIPLSSNVISINFGSDIAGYQWDINQWVLDQIKYTDGGRDPKSKDFFSYFVSPDRKKVQILTFLEENNSNLSYFSRGVSAANMAQYDILFPYVYGSELWILLDSNFKAPVHKINTEKVLDLQSSSWSYIGYISNTTQVEWTWDDLISILPFTTCKKLKELIPSLENGLYTINPTWFNSFQVYCDMELDGGGWTLVARSSINAVGWRFGWMIWYGAPWNDNDKYSLWKESAYLNFSEIMMALYSTEKDITYAQAIEVDTTYIKNPANYSSASRSLSCREVYPTDVAWRSTCDSEVDGTAFSHSNWWFIDYRSQEVKTWNREEGYFFRYYATPIITTMYGGAMIEVISWFKPDTWFDFSESGEMSNVFTGNKHGMIFVR